jgi:hypothetical protein
MKIIMNCEPEEAEALAALIVREIPTFKHGRGPGWGWQYTLSKGRCFFLRALKDGISATPIDD